MVFVIRTFTCVHMFFADYFSHGIWEMTQTLHSRWQQIVLTSEADASKLAHLTLVFCAFDVAMNLHVTSYSQGRAIICKLEVRIGETWLQKHKRRGQQSELVADDIYRRFEQIKGYDWRQMARRLTPRVEIMLRRWDLRAPGSGQPQIWINLKIRSSKFSSSDHLVQEPNSNGDEFRMIERID